MKILIENNKIANFYPDDHIFGNEEYEVSAIQLDGDWLEYQNKKDKLYFKDGKICEYTEEEIKASPIFKQKEFNELKAKKLEELAEAEVIKERPDLKDYRSKR